MAINGQITEHKGEGMPLQNMSEITHNNKLQVCETLHITLNNLKNVWCLEYSSFYNTLSML